MFAPKHLILPKGLSVLKQYAMEILRSSFYRAGIEVRGKVSEEFFDLTQPGLDHPVAAAHMSCGKPFLIKVPLDRIVTFNYTFFSLGIDGPHPFVKTLQEYEKNNDMSSEGSYLRKYYELYQPSTASELMDIPSPSYERFNDLSALSATPIWSRKSPEEYCAYVKSVNQKEDEEHGVKLGEFVGCSQYGPVVSTKLTIEYERLVRLYESIKKHELRSGKSKWITGIALANESDWVILISEGNHRLACLSALGYESAIVYLLKRWAPGGIMLRSCSRHFPTVVNGYHTEEEALAIFDRVISKKQPKAASRWLAHCNLNT